MTRAVRNQALLSVSVLFTAAFVVICVPEVITGYGGNLIAAFGGGFETPITTGYSLDVFGTWAVLAIWVVYERTARGVRRGWIALVLGTVPGVCVGLAAYLVIRERSLRHDAPAPRGERGADTVAAS